MDPLSIIASVAGILALAAKITSVVTNYIAEWKDAPACFHNVVKEISDLNLCLRQLEPFLRRSEYPEQSREEAISVEQIVILSTSLVLSMSELERLVDTMGLNNNRYSSMARVRWVNEKERISPVLSRIRASKDSLNLILTIFTCDTVEAIQSSVSSLGDAVERILQTSAEVLQRVSNLESIVSGPTGNLTSEDPSLFRDGSQGCGSPNNMEESLLDAQDTTLNLQFDARTESEIYASRVYVRNMHRHSMSSLSSGHGSVAGTSFLSGISLAQVSNISVISLPIFKYELWRPEHWGNTYEEGSITHPSDRQLAPSTADDTSMKDYADTGAFTPTSSAGRQSSKDGRLMKRLLKPRSKGKMTPEALRSAPIDRMPENDRKQLKTDTKILLLGDSEAGKSTVLQQMRREYSQVPVLEERKLMRRVILAKIFMAMSVYFEAMREREIGYESDTSPHYEMVVERAHAEAINLEFCLTLDVLDAVKGLWADCGFQKVIKKGHEHALNDNFGYLMKHIDRISRPWYLPSNEDLLSMRLRTTGITEIIFKIGTSNCHVFDVGGRRWERWKWVHAFEAFPTLLFVAPLSGYNQCLIEDVNGNQMIESLMLFGGILNVPMLKKCPITLLLTKLDLYEKKIKQTPIRDYFPDFEGGSVDGDAGKEYFINQFLSLNNSPDRKINVFCADVTDTERFAPFLREFMDAAVNNAKSRV